MLWVIIRNVNIAVPVVLQASTCVQEKGFTACFVIMYRAVVLPDLISHTQCTSYRTEQPTSMCRSAIETHWRCRAGFSRKMTSMRPKMLSVIAPFMFFQKSLLWTMKLKSHLEVMYFKSVSKLERTILADVGQVD